MALQPIFKTWGKPELVYSVAEGGVLLWKQKLTLLSKNQPTASPSAFLWLIAFEITEW